MSRMAAVTRMPSALRSGLNMISMGNSLPSLRRAVSSMPVPICCARGFFRGAKAIGDQAFREAPGKNIADLLSHSSSRPVAKLLFGL